MKPDINWRQGSVSVLEESTRGPCRTDHISTVPVAEPDPPCTESVPPVIPISLARDLAVQLVGSDAGKEKRFRPTSVMTKGATGEELAAIETAMQPFLQDEILRFHEKRSHKPELCRINATPEQARALKKFCLAYAAHLRSHLERHGHDDRHHRSQQRLNQAYAVISQVNVALGTLFDDGLTLQDCEKALVIEMEALQQKLDSFAARTVARSFAARTVARPESNGHERGVIAREITVFAQGLRQVLRRLKSSETTGALQVH